MLQKIDNKLCSGCMACISICPVSCIEIDLSKRKRFYKRIDSLKCIHCGLCEKVCPHTGDVSCSEPKLGLNVWTESRGNLRYVSSGGVATTAYNYALKNKIFCVGVCFDSNYQLKYRFLNSPVDIYLAAGSKYVYSQMEDIYQQVGTVLLNGERVLFVGLPCHVGGLKKYCALKSVPENNLLAIDLVCHGVSTPYLFQKYVNALQRKGILTGEENVAFRKKYNPYGVTVLKNGRAIYQRNRYLDSYMSLYVKNYYSESCYSCRFAKKQRIGDLTIMDCSTPGERRKCKRMGGSSILVNTSKGLEFWKNIQPQFEIEKYSPADIVREDPMLRGPASKPRLYTFFWLLEKAIGFSRAENLLYGVSNRIAEAIELSK